jgi:hypothetical protein
MKAHSIPSDPDVAWVRLASIWWVGEQLLKSQDSAIIVFGSGRIRNCDDRDGAGNHRSEHAGAGRRGQPSPKLNMLEQARLRRRIRRLRFESSWVRCFLLNYYSQPVRRTQFCPELSGTPSCAFLRLEYARRSAVRSRHLAEAPSSLERPE